MPGFVDTFLNAEVFFRIFPMLLKGVWNTILLALTTITLGGLAGVLICLARLYGPRPLRLKRHGFFRNLRFQTWDLQNSFKNLT